jgi:hypothetical protein
MRAGRQKDVLGLQIPMRDAGLVRGHHRRTDRQHRFRQLDGRHGAGARQPLRQILPLHQLHDQIGQPRLAAHVGDVHDVGVSHLRGELGLAKEPRAGSGHGRDGRPEHLDGDALAYLRVRGLVDRPHPACTEQLDDLVLAQASTGGQGDFAPVLRDLTRVRHRQVCL